MNQSQWLILFLAIQIIHGLGTWKLYIKAKRQAWEAFVPVYNAIVLMKIINRPWWWTILMILPIVNLIMLPAVWVETARSFGKDSNLDTFLAIATLGFYAFYLNYIAEVSYIENRDLKPKTSAGDWISSILFAIVAATIVHTYFFQPFVIPSSSLEKSLLVGDFLIVSKIHYGPRAPMTTIAAPMVHDTIPVIKKKSYLYSDKINEKESSWKNWFQLPYFRIPSFQTIKRNEIVVFGQPADTLRDMNDFTPDRNYYKPIDKKTNLVKRCVGIAGDTLEIRNGNIFINGEETVYPDRTDLMHNYVWTARSQITQRIIDKFEIENFMYFFEVDPKTWDDEGLRQFIETNPGLAYLKEYRRDSTKVEIFGQAAENVLSQLNVKAIPNKYMINISKNFSEGLAVRPETIAIERFANAVPERNIFPRDAMYSWNYDNFGPLYIPEAGKTIAINVSNYNLYKRVISEYEGHKIVAKGNQIFIDDKLADSYTFKQDYYWMMGDNRHNSIDSRAWGFVPFNHVIGKPVFIWMSIDGINDGLSNWRPRTDRIFTTVSGDGGRISYFWPFVVVVAGISFYNRRRKKKKAANKS